MRLDTERSGINPLEWGDDIDDIENRDVLRFLGEGEASVQPTLSNKQPGFGQCLEYLGQIPTGDAGDHGDLLRGLGFPIAVGQEHDRSQSVICSLRYEHEATLFYLSPDIFGYQDNNRRILSTIRFPVKKTPEKPIVIRFARSDGPVKHQASQQAVCVILAVFAHVASLCLILLQLIWKRL